MNRFTLVFTLVAATALASPLAAQGRVRGLAQGVPPGHKPPPGMCRIWIDGVPAGQQPAPTDCATAVRNRPANGRVIFGDDARGTTTRPKDRSWQDRASLFGGGIVADREGKWAQRDKWQQRTGSAGGALPQMMAGVLAARGQRTADATRWLGSQDLVARPAGAGRTGAPATVQWFDRGNRLVQVWTDGDGDGRADRVEFYRDGQRVRVVEQ